MLSGDAWLDSSLCKNLRTCVGKWAVLVTHEAPGDPGELAVTGAGPV